MPNQRRAGVRPRSVAIDDELWEAAKASAAERNEDVSKVIRRALERYVQKTRSRKIRR